MALGGYYDGIVPLIDSIVETYQGRYGILRGYQGGVLKDIENDEDIVEYFSNLSKFVDAVRKGLPQDTELLNMYDEVQALINSTLYKLRFLK
jgi:hypothetical protein